MTKEIKEQVSYYMNKYKISEDLANDFIDAIDQSKYTGFILGKVETKQEYDEEIKRLKSDHTKWTNELKTKIDRLSQDDTRLKELLSQYIEGTEALQHKLALTDLQTANRDFSAGYCKALQDLMRHFEGIDYEIID
jgi:predicted nuclease with TOPRIM domain